MDKAKTTNIILVKKYIDDGTGRPNVALCNKHARALKVMGFVIAKMTVDDTNINQLSLEEQTNSCAFCEHTHELVVRRKT